MKFDKSVWLWAFALAAAANLLGITLQILSLVQCSKPLLMPALGAWFFQATFGMKGWLRKAVLAALLFSTIGDVLLMFEGPTFFLLGLAAFLVAHIFYLSGFLSNTSFPVGYLRKNAIWVLPFLAYWLGLLSILWPGIPAEMRPPVAIYGCAITVMAMSVLNLKNRVEPLGWRWAMAGAVFFVLSDSLIALSKFGHPFSGAALAVMLTYIFGQYLLVRGTARAAGWKA